MVLDNSFILSPISTNIANCVMKCSINPTSDSIKMAYFNSRSLNMDDKFAEFVNLIDGLNFHFIAITETWLKPWMSSNSLAIPGYTLIRNDRLTRSGGVAIYILNSLKWKILDQSSNGLTEFLFIEVFINKSIIVIGVVYNTGGGNVDVIEEVLSSLVGYDDIIIAGDFNINMLNNSKSSNQFKNVLVSQSLNYLPNDQPTHYSNFHQSASLLDLIITKDSAKIEKLVQLDVSIFDHDFIYLSYLMPVAKAPISAFQYRSYKYINLDALAYDCVNIHWDSIFETVLIDQKVSIFNTHLLSLFDKHVPIKTFVVPKQTTPLWFSVDIKIAIADKEMCYKRWKRNKTNDNRRAFYHSRCRVKKLIRSAKSKYLNKMLDHNLSPRNLWTNIRNLGLSKDVKVIPPHFSPNEINNWFAKTISTGDNINNINTNNIDRPRNVNINIAHKFRFGAVNESAVKLAVLRIKSNSVGDDGIPLKFIKLILEYILPILCHLINSCLDESRFPSQWKISRVVPVAKCSNPKDLINLRPISILPMMSKVLERVMCDQMVRYLENNNMIDKFQSGFRSKHSTATALLKITDDISIALDKGHVALLVLLDFSKAFDSLNHSMLLVKLDAYFNFSSQAIKLIGNYLSGRSQYVSFNNKNSHNINVMRGVPQGSILGPILFMLFINDITSVIKHCKYHMYADDVQIYASNKVDDIEHITASINDDIRAISNWALINELKLNYSKSQVLHINSYNLNITYPAVYIGDDVVPFVDKARNLGFIMNSKFTWDSHVSHICSNIYAGLRRLSKFKKSTPTKTKKALAHSLLITHLTYADIVMGSLSYEHRRTLNVAFNSITRYVYSLSRYDHITPFSKNLLGCSFDNYLKYRQCVFLFKIRYGQSVDYLIDKLQTGIFERNPSIILPKFKTALRAKSFFIFGAQTWNCLPLTLKRITHLHRFRNECLKYFSRL